MAHCTNAGGRRTLALALAGLVAAAAAGRAGDEADLRAAFTKALEAERQGNYAEAARLLERAAELAPRVFGPDHPGTAAVLYNLAGQYGRQGRAAEAEPLFRRAVAIYEKAPNAGQRDLASCLDGLAVLCESQGRYREAEPLFRRGLAIREREFGAGHPVVATSLTNMGNMYSHQGKLAEAEPLLSRALAVLEKAHGADHPVVADALNNLAALYGEQGKPKEAEPLHRRALAIREKALGPRHPDVAKSLLNLANAYAAQNKFAEAEPLHRRALAAWEAALGPGHPDVNYALVVLATTCAARGRWAEAADLTERQRRGVRGYVARELPALPEADQLAFLETADAKQLHFALALGLERRADPGAADRSAGWLLNGKAVAHQALAERALLARDLADPARRELARQLQDARRRHAALALAAAPPGREGERAEQLRALDAQRVDLERKLAAAAGTAAPADPWVDLADVRRRLPAGGVLVEFARFRGFEFTTGDHRAPRYAAWVIPPAGQGEVQVIDLGPAGPIDATVAAARQAIVDAQGGDPNRSKTVELKSLTRPKSIAALGERDAEKLTRQPLDALARLVLHPLLPAIAGKGQWVISPDASLWLAPWAALPLDGAAYAVERHTIALAVSGRDLAAPPPAPRADGGPPTVLADPDFDLAPADAAARTRTLLPGSRPAAQGLGGPVPPAKLPKVGRLPGTAVEANAVKLSIQKYGGREPWLYLGGNALEAVAKALRGPRVVVFSTHGFALPDQGAEADAAATPAKATRAGAFENPLTRCGLLLSACNRRGEGAAEDGVLTGLEIVGTDLRGTELVVLSACETGLGDVRNGEGVAGLRQAFQLAGARSVVATLWQVPDRESANLMTAFFDNLAAGKGQAEALRAAQLAQVEVRRKQGGAAHPYFWAAYTVTGQ